MEEEQKKNVFHGLYLVRPTSPYSGTHNESAFTSLPELLPNKDQADFKPSALGRKQYLPEIE